MGTESEATSLKESFVLNVNFVQKWHLFWLTGYLLGCLVWVSDQALAVCQISLLLKVGNWFLLDCAQCCI